MVLTPSYMRMSYKRVMDQAFSLVEVLAVLSDRLELA
jgi:hypothetical protein